MDSDGAGSRDDVLPPLANDLLGIAWILLFTVRWAGVNLLLAAGLMNAAMVSDLDDRVLFRCYLILFAVTVLVIALRAVRGAAARSRAAATRRSVAAVDPAHQGARAPEQADRSPKPGD